MISMIISILKLIQHLVCLVVFTPHSPRLDETHWNNCLLLASESHHREKKILK